MNEITASNIKEFMLHTLHLDPYSKLYRVLEKAFVVADDAKFICDNLTYTYKVCLLYNRKEVSGVISFEEMTNPVALDKFAEFLETKFSHLVATESLKHIVPGGPVDPLSHTITIDRLATPIITDSILGSIHIGKESIVDKDTSDFFKKVKNELEARGEFEIDIVSFVDVLIKLGIAKPKD